MSGLKDRLLLLTLACQKTEAQLQEMLINGRICEAQYKLVVGLINEYDNENLKVMKSDLITEMMAGPIFEVEETRKQPLESEKIDAQPPVFKRMLMKIGIL